MTEKLLAYQKVDEKLKKIENELGKSEERKKYAEARKFLEGVEERVNKLDDRASELTALFNDALSEQKNLKEQAEDISRAIDSIEDEAEASYLIKKADELFAKIKSLDEKAGKIEADMKALIKEYAGIISSTKLYQAQYKEFKEKYNELKESKAPEMKAVTKELEELAKVIDKDLLAKYNKKREEKIFPIVYPVRDKFCGACGMEMPTATIQRLKNGEVIECDNCRRLMCVDK